MTALADELHAIVARHAGDEGFAGVCLVKRGDEALLHKAFGLAHRGYGIPNSLDSRFDIASVTKVFTAAATMQLVERGELTLETPVMPYLGIGGTRVSDTVTIFHLLTHTSGIADDADEEAGEDYELLFVDKPNYSIRETKDFLPQFVHKEPVFAPGEGVRYNNCAFVLLGLAIERASGISYREYVRRHVFERAGMSGADFLAMDGVHPRFAEHYKRIERADGSIEWRKHIYSYPPIGSPDGGATVTALDLDRFVRAIRSHALTGEAAAGELLRPHVKKREHEAGSDWNGFAFEFRLDRDGSVVRLGKEGMNAGVASDLVYYPGTDTTTVLLANQDCDVWSIQRELEPLVTA